MLRRKRSLGGRSQAGCIGLTITMTRALPFAGQSGPQEGGSLHGGCGAPKGRRGGGVQVNEEAPSKFMHWFAPLLGASSMGKGIVRKQTSKEGHHA